VSAFDEMLAICLRIIRELEDVPLAPSSRRIFNQQEHSAVCLDAHLQAQIRRKLPLQSA